jgi:hypothetical protein
MITRNKFDVPVLEYYSYGASYSGGRRGTKKDDFNYHITVEKTDDGKEVRVNIWYGIFNLENSTEVSNAVFPADEAGLAKAYGYIDESFDLWAKEHTPIN